MKSKRTSLLLLIAMGILCIGISLFMHYSNQEAEGKNKTEPKLVTEDNGEKAGQYTEGQESDKVAVKGEEDSDAAATIIELERDKPVQEINSDMYEWPHGNSRYANRKEPDMVFYLAQRKEWFDELVGAFQKYEGTGIYGIIGWDEEEEMVYYDHMFSEHVVAIYDKYEQFFREGIISSMDVDGDGLSFEAVKDSHEYLYYYYDEYRNEETDEFLDDNNIVHVAPHWWWQEPVDPH